MACHGVKRWILLLGAWLILPLQAHDFWLAPQNFRHSEPGVVRVYAYLGDHFEGESIIPAPQLVDRFWIKGAGEEIDLVPAGAMGIAGLARIKQPGIALIAYRGKRKYLELKADKFDRYLEEEALEDIRAWRRENERQDEPGREWFSRCAKALIAVGEQSQWPESDLVAGFPLEIVAVDSPLKVSDKNVMVFQLLYRGKALAGKRIVAYRRGHGRQAISAVTDGQGLVVLPINQAGVWMLKAVHMVPMPAQDRADWESFWASLTFETTLD